MTGFQLAELNIATLREPLESPSMANFVANLERINALAEQTPGFVWRLQDDEGRRDEFARVRRNDDREHVGMAGRGVGAAKWMGIMPTPRSCARWREWFIA